MDPEHAAGYVRELTFQGRAVAVRGPGGRLLAGEESATVEGVVTARLGGHEIAVDVGPQTLPGLAHHDAEQALRAVLSPAEDL